ncbi:hypothetical protein EZ428_03855 [Pedobacter frigiditerrae]|uniref:YXWGXW repeat-containing protein n=1 Tax=Pedobacter frigiditerrae TaxID=2530452 RepID=A0A4R0N3I5_9SPHI|nr:DUF6600 domain-containing protein [Pedobacter frigiditerrae]TCC93917.1 hypothetical protein EZ428_03855 [Pedobacter frigiditerrae]
MKNMIKLPAMLVGLMLLFAGTTQVAKAQQEDVSLQSFYDELSPYGTWIQDPQYGYVWRPDVDQEDFRPYYSNGRWAMTEYGNTWVSNYDWGWAPFHYGRWIYNRYNQWVWLPDTVWGPAWVSWRSGGGYYGWAPLGPSISIGINIGRSGYRVPDMCWNFIPYNNIYINSYPRYNYGRNRVYIQNTVIINNTYVRNNRTYYTGPRAEEVRRATNQNVTVYNVNRSSRPGASRIDDRNVNIYSPRASRDNGNSAPRNAVQGSINRGPVGRDNRDNRDNNNVTANRGDRGNNNGGFDRNNGNVNQGGDRNSDRGYNGGTSTRPSRNGNEVTAPQGRENGNRGNENNGVANQRPSVFDRRSDGNNNPSQRVERSQPTPQSQPQEQRVERSREMPQQQRVERQQPVQQAQPQQQRVERPQPVQQAQPQQRMERPQSQPQRVERTQSAPQQRSSGGGSESRGERGGGGGRPGRG